MLIRLAWTAALVTGMPHFHDIDRAPSTTRYRIDQSLRQEIDASSAGGARENTSFNVSSFITVTLKDSAGGKAMRVVVDSMRADSAIPFPIAVLDSAKGATFVGFIARSGKPSELRLVSGNPAATQVQGLLSDFFPWIKSNARVGDSWTDTTAKVNGLGPDSVTIRRVSAYKAAGNEMRYSRTAVRIAYDFTSSIAGTQPTPSGPARIEGTSTGQGTYYVGKDGRYLGGDWQLQSSLTMSGAFATEPLPVTVVQKTRVIPLK